MSFEDQGGSGQFSFVVLVETRNQHIWLAENSLSFNSRWIKLVKDSSDNDDEFNDEYEAEGY